MKWHILIALFLLILTAGCVSEVEQVSHHDSYTGAWIHDSRYPIFLFHIQNGGMVNIYFMDLIDPQMPDYATMVAGTWEISDSLLDITYTAPLSGEVRILHLKAERNFLLLTGASAGDGTMLDIEDLEGIRFVRGEEYSRPLPDYISIDHLQMT